MIHLPFLPPILIFFFGFWFMRGIANYTYIKSIFVRKGISNNDGKLLNKRWCGYDSPALRRHFDAMDDTAQMYMLRLLKLDLFFFPVLYCCAFLLTYNYSLDLLKDDPQTKYWMIINHWWIYVPVFMTFFADCCENIFQIDLLYEFIEDKTIHNDIKVKKASAFTQIKLYSASVMFVIWLVFIFLVIFR